MPTFRHGKSARFELDNAAGTLVELSDVIEDISFSQSLETAETTTMGNSAKTYITGLSDATISVSGKFDATIDAQINAVQAGLADGTIASSSWTYRANSGTVGAGNPEYQGEALITSYEVSASVGDVVTFSLELQVTGAIVRDNTGA
jgi:predicted secreted protein